MTQALSPLRVICWNFWWNTLELWCCICLWNWIPFWFWFLWKLKKIGCTHFVISFVLWKNRWVTCRTMWVYFARIVIHMCFESVAIILHLESFSSFWHLWMAEVLLESWYSIMDIGFQVRKTPLFTEHNLMFNKKKEMRFWFYRN